MGLEVKRSSSAIVFALITSLASAAGAQEVNQPAPRDSVQWWKGVSEIQEMRLDFVVVFRPAEESGRFTATIDIPVQMAKDLPLVDVVLTATDVRFTIPPPASAVFELKRSEDGRTADGEFKQHGLTIPVHMERITEAEAKSVGPPRPQTPKPPFPYKQREVSYENPVDGTKLAGTLTIPEGPGPHPAVILITGSGPQDRDETIFGHKPFFVLADHLTRRGVAVLRVDDRGTGGSSGGVAQPTSKDFANDVISGMRFLKKQPEIDKDRIGLVGHSEGGIIAPLIASRSKGEPRPSESGDVACIVLLAGSGLPGDQLLRLQQEAFARAGGVPAEDLKKLLGAQRVLYELLAEEANDDAVRAAMREYVALQLKTGGKKASAKNIEEGVKLGMAQVRNPWMRWFTRHDPRDVLPKVKCPVLALIGSLDLQVPPKENLPAIAEALSKGGNPDATVKELAGLNHLFQEAQTGRFEEYMTIEQTISPAALDEITNWLRKRFKLEE